VKGYLQFLLTHSAARLTITDIVNTAEAAPVSNLKSRQAIMGTSR
jgi:hypothetical protein